MNTSDVLADPEWLPHRYDEATDSFRFVHVPREAQRAATFLTDEYLDNTGDFVAIARSSIDRSALPMAPVHFVFHSAYCCSTLIARMFDAPGISFGLKEPVLLNDMVGWRQRGADPRTLAAVLDLSLALLSRPFAPGEAVVIKPSNIVNSIAPAIMGLRPEASAILLYAPIEDFLSSIAVKGLWGRQWVRKALLSQARDRTLTHAMTTEELLELTDLQIAGFGWLSNHGIFAQMRERFGDDRVAICDSVNLLRDPRVTAADFFAHFDMPLTDQKAAEVSEGEAFTSNSKDRSPYSAGERRKRLDATIANNREEIDMVAEWVKYMAEGVGLDPAPRAFLDGM